MLVMKTDRMFPEKAVYGRDTGGSGSSIAVIADLKDEIESALEDLDFSDAHPLVREACSYSIAAGGKRVRPILILLTGKALGAERRRLMPVAIATELLHTASLILDDIMDESGLRRGMPSVYARFGRSAALMTAYYLIFKSTDIVMRASRDDRLRNEYLLLMSRSSGKMIDAQRRDVRGRKDLSLASYMREIYNRSGQFFECGAALSAKVSGADERTAKALGRMGGKIGVFFQLRDDLLDYRNNGSLGKPHIHDFMTGKFTAPVLIALEMVPEKRRQIMGLLRKERKTLDDGEKMRALLLETGALDECQRIILQNAHECKMSVRRLLGSGEKRIISDLIDYLCYRVV
jgi:geranylgeranyl pyrophosphate synthase